MSTVTMGFSVSTRSPRSSPLTMYSLWCASTVVTANRSGPCLPAQRVEIGERGAVDADQLARRFGTLRVGITQADELDHVRVALLDRCPPHAAAAMPRTDQRVAQLLGTRRNGGLSGLSNA